MELGLEAHLLLLSMEDAASDAMESTLFKIVLNQLRKADLRGVVPDRVQEQQTE